MQISEFRAVLDAVLNSDDDSDETNFSDLFDIYYYGRIMAKLLG